MRIAITGASGQLGRLIIERLRTKVPSSDIVALVRTPSKATDLGVEVREADYTRPDTSVIVKLVVACNMSSSRQLELVFMVCTGPVLMALRVQMNHINTTPVARLARPALRVFGACGFINGVALHK
jgi:aspartate-semialdehyde dehydrogenase